MEKIPVDSFFPTHHSLVQDAHVGVQLEAVDVRGLGLQRRLEVDDLLHVGELE